MSFVSFVVIVFLVVPAMRTIEGTSSAAGFRFALVVSRYNDFVTDRLQSGAVAALTAAGASDITVVRVPGAFEIPIAAQRCAQTGRFDAVICLGCLIRGATAHFEYIASAEERAWFKNLPTTFELPRESVDKLRSVGRRLLSEDPQFQNLVRALKGSPPVVPR